MKNRNFRKIIFGLIIIISCAIFSRCTPQMGEHIKYDCDVKNFRLSTTIKIDKENEDFAEIKGNIFKIVTDPLTMYDLDGNRIAYAGDAYRFIAQDSHAIFTNNVGSVEMVGLIELFGEDYDIYDFDGEKIAKVKFNMFDTSGKMYDIDGNLIADYESFIFFNDYNVRISKECNIDENTVLMIFASYYSDQNYDSKA